MQHNFKTFSDFIRRTDALAVRSGLNLSEIHGLLGISKAMVFAYRSGKNPISNKAWLKLEEAEKKVAAEKGEQPQFEQSSANPKDASVCENPDFLESTILREEATPYRTPVQILEERVTKMEATLRSMQEALNRFLE